MFAKGLRRKPLVPVDRPETDGEDFCGKDGARRLKERIEEYWAKRGHSVQIHLQGAGFVSAMRTARTDIRSDMQNGFPKDALPALPVSKRNAA